MTAEAAREPSTEAGRQMLDEAGTAKTKLVLAIEAQAAAAERQRLADGVKAAIVVRLIAGNTDQTYTPTEVSTLVTAVVDEQVARLLRADGGAA